MNTVVVNLKYLPHDVYIGRPRKGDPWGFGNPFKIGKDGTREQVVEKFEVWVRHSTDLRAKWIRDHLEDLRGKRLACFCYPQACHGDVYLKMLQESK